MKNRQADISALISWVYTENLDSTAAFYAGLPGFDCVRDKGSAKIFAVTGGACIGVCQVFAGRVVEPAGGMITLVTDDVDGWYRRLRERGIGIAEAPHRLEQFGIYRFLVEDPNGYQIEFQQFDRPLQDRL